MGKQAVRWIAFITALNCGAVLALTQCSSFEGLRPAKKDTTSESRLGSYLAGRFAISERDPEAASHYFRTALKFDPENPALLERVMLSEVAGGDIDKAATYAEALLVRMPAAKLPNLVVGVRALRDAGYAKARQSLARIKDSPAAVIAAQVGIAYAYHSEGNVDAALAALKPLVDEGATRAFALYHEGLIMDLAGRSKEASPILEEANRLSGGESLRILEAYGNHLARMGKTAQAREVFESFLAKLPDNPVISRALARVNAGQAPERVVANARQGMAETLYGIAASVSEDKSFDIPVFYLQLALALEPQHELSLSLLADRLESVERYEDAIAVYERVPTTSPIYASIRQQVAQNLQRLEKPDEAIRVLKAALNGSRDDLRTYAGIADVQRGEEQFSEAIENYSKAIAMIGKPEERHWLLYYTRGIAYERAKRWDESEADLKQSLKLKPSNPSVMNYLAYSWVDRGVNVEQALEMLKQAVAARPEDGYIVDSLGWAYFKLGKYDEAVKYLEQAILLEPGLAAINDHLGDAYWKVGRHNEARFQWQHALTMKPEKEDEPKIRRKLEVGLEETASAPAPGKTSK
jgi:tetratricopeptide (TPR) repeat protein